MKNVMVICTPNIPTPVEYNNLHKGALLTLVAEPENPVDKGAVAICLDDGTRIGHLGNRPGVTVPAGVTCAGSISGRLGRPEVASARIRLIEPRNYGTPTQGADGELTFPQTHWLSEVYWLPDWSVSQTREFTLDIGGVNGVTDDLSDTLENFENITDAFVLRKQDFGRTTHVMVYRQENLSEDNPVPCGEVKNAPEDLLSALDNEPEIKGSPVEVTGDASFRITVTVSGTGYEEYHDDIERIVRACIMQVRDAKERIDFMRSQNLPRELIHGVLKAITYNEHGVVSAPSQNYLESPDGNELRRSLGYRLSGKNIRLVGEKGAGKNTLVYTVCWLLNRTVYRLQGNSDLDKVDLLGGMALNNGGTHFELSQFLKTLVEGGDVVIDEINSIKPEVALVIHSLVDDARAIDVPGFGRVAVNPGSRVWATMNEGYVGTGELNPATADRFMPIHMGESVNLEWLLTERCPHAKRADILICCRIYDKILQSVRDGSLQPECITTRGYIDALESTTWLPLSLTLIDSVAGRVQDPDDRKMIEDFIQVVFN